MATLTREEYNYYLNWWCKQQGLKYRDFELHPRIEDVLLLVHIRNTLWTQMTHRPRAHWAAIWEWCYHQRLPLKKKQVKILEQIAQDIIIKQQATIKARQRIQLKRHRPKTVDTKSTG